MKSEWSILHPRRIPVKAHPPHPYTRTIRSCTTPRRVPLVLGEVRVPLINVPGELRARVGGQGSTRGKHP